MSPHEGDLFPVSQEHGRAVVGAFLVGHDPAPFVVQVQDGEVRFVIPARDANRGSKPHRPDLLLKLAIYEHSQGRPQPVQWMKDLEENKTVQWLVYGMRPSQATLYEFRDRVQPLLQDLNQQVIRTAIDQGHTTGSRGALCVAVVALGIATFPFSLIP
jgi:hypothetical protein